MDDEAEIQDEVVPALISDEYMKTVLTQTDEFVKDLRSQENYKLANQVIKLVTISENLQFQLKNEQQKIEDLLEKFVDADGRIEKAVKISQRDYDVIKKLKDEVTNAWKSTDAAKLREQHTHESLNQTRKKYLALLEQNKKMAVQYEDTDELGESAATVLQECDRLTTEIAELNKRLLIQRAYSEELQKKLEASQEKHQELYHQWDTATNESLSNRKKVETLTFTVNELREQVENGYDELTHFKKQSEMLHKRLKFREQQLNEMTEKLEKISSENSILTTAKSKLELSLKALKSETNLIRQEMAQHQNYIRLKEDESKKLFLENEREMKRCENLQRKIASLEKALSKNEMEIANKKTEIHTAEKERDLIKKASDDVKRENDKMLKKIDQQINEMEKHNGIIHDLKQERQSIIEEKANISSDLKNCRDSEKKAKLNQKKLQTKLESVESEKSFLTQSLKNLNEENEEKKKFLEKLKHELSEAHEQISHYKHEYSNSLKNLKDTRADFQRSIEREADVKDRLVKCKNQAEDTNEKLANKLEEIVSLMKKIKKFEKINRETKRDLERCQDTLRITRGEVKDLRHENKIQKDELRENDARFVKMKGQMDKILRERDLIANQMFRKNDENGVLEQQVVMLKMSIDRGNSLYQERLDDIKIMKNEILDLRSQCNVLKRGMENTFDMRHETLQLHRKLNQERVKVKALEEEMLTPINIHRWRKLRWLDPDRMKLTRKCHRYQRHSFRQMLKISRYEGIIKEMEDKNSNLRKELERYSNFNIQQKLVVTKSQLNLNTKRMKAAIALSRASECDVKSKDLVIDQLQKKLTELQNQLFKEKRGKMKLTEKLHALKFAESKITDVDCGKIFDIENLGTKFKIGILQK